MPYSNREWLDWLSKNKDYFMGVLRDATKNLRSIGQRLVPAAELPPCERIQPKASDAASKPTWVKKLVQCGSGWCSLRWGRNLEMTVVCFFACCRGECRVLPLHNQAAGFNEYTLPFYLDFANCFLTVDEFLKIPAAVGLLDVPEEDVVVWKLTMQCIGVKT